MPVPPNPIIYFGQRSLGYAQMMEREWEKIKPPEDDDDDEEEEEE